MDVKEAEGILFRAWDRVCAREQKLGFGNLRRAEQVFVSIWMLEAEVNNGGFSQYMFNSAGDQGEFVLEALREVGAGPVAETCEQFYVMLPGGRPARTQDERQAQLDSAADIIGEVEFEERCGVLEQRFYALEEDLRSLVVAYVRANGLV